jgi:prepilin-type N-terminal cleavage/methylation domain-containing protein
MKYEETKKRINKSSDLQTSGFRPRRGFTLIEFLIIIAILVILIAITIPALRLFERGARLTNSTEEIINTLRLAQDKTLASEEESSWGVYFSTSTTADQYTLFKGSSYSTRDASFDKIQRLSQTIEIYEINLAGQSEVVFDRVSGRANPAGIISLRLKTEPSKTKTIYIENSGQVGLINPSSPSDADREKDSRHVHLDYSGSIATSTENLILTFSDPPNPDITETIIIADNLKDGQIYWSSSVTVGGEVQTLKIHTHRLNNPDTQFSIHRDKRYNSKALKVEISEDFTGNLIQYTADGQTAKGTSIFVSEPDWQ